MHYPTLARLLVVPSILHSAAAGWQVGDTVKTTSGQIRGHASDWQPSVSEYLGVPFAKPPVGPLRWKAPEAYKSDSAFVASKFSPDCPGNTAPMIANASAVNSAKGIVFASLSQYGDEFSEDCLTLNVWTKPQSGEKKKAVLVWIYGGGFVLGNTASPSYNGARLAAEYDVTVVSMNYRVNIFGFPGAPGLADQNLGLLDQRLAVEWIRDNIAAFGGDPARIVLFGESAGGASVDMYSYAWTKDPIVSAFIPESGTASAGGATGDSSKGERWFKASQKLGCGGREAGNEKVLDCMRSKPWKAVADAIKPEGSAASMGGMGDFGPAPDGKVVFSDYKARAAAGNFIKRPMLVGNNAHEINLFTVILGQTPSAAMASIAGAAFSCPSADAAKARSANKVKAWRYLYAGEWPNQMIAPDAGAWHGSEIGMVFGSIEYQQQFYGKMTKQSISFPDTEEQKQLTKTMMTAWTSFAKDPENALEKLGWPVYDPAKPTIVKIGAPNSAKVTFLAPKTQDTACGLMSGINISGLLGKMGSGSGGLGGLSSLLGKGLPKQS